MNPGVANRESCNFFKADPTKNDKTPLQNPTDFFLPLSTKMNDLRVKGVNFCEWNEEFIINELAANIYKPNVCILFELLEFNPKLVAVDSDLLNSERLYPVAWAYLRPLGTASLHMDKIKLQLYKYKFRSDQGMKFNRPFDPRTPEVLLELEWPKKTLFNSFLEVEL